MSQEPLVRADLDDEELLQALVREVDAELLEGVAAQVLEAVDVQDAEGPLGLHALRRAELETLHEILILNEPILSWRATADSTFPRQ